MSTQQQDTIKSDLAHLFIELSQDVNKREQFRKNPSSLLQNKNFNAKELAALRSGDLHTLEAVFHLGASNPLLCDSEIARKRTIPGKKR